MDYPTLLAQMKERQRELWAEANHQRLLKQAKVARRAQRTPVYGRAMTCLAARLIAAGRWLEEQYNSPPAWDVAAERTCR